MRATDPVARPTTGDRNPSPRVCIVGNAALDLSLRVERLPVAGETSLAVETLYDLGGKGANQAVVAARADTPTQLFAAIGQDAEGDRIVAQLSAEGIDTSHMLRVPYPTDLSIITVDARGENTIVTRNEAAAHYHPDPRSIVDATRAGDWIALQGNLSADFTARMLRAARVSARRTLLNPGPVSFDCVPLLGDVDVLVVNRVEAATLSTHDDPARAALVLQHAGARDVCVTLGAQGVLWCSEHTTQHLPAMPAQAIDTVGAGDAFCGTLLAAFGHDLAMPLALRWAQAVAAVVVTRRGAQASFPDRAAMRDLLLSVPPWVSSTQAR